MSDAPTSKSLYNSNQCNGRAFEYMKKLEQQLAAKDALLDDFCKWAFAHPPKRPDHACKYCVPNGPIVKADWMCCYHKAMKRLEESK